MNFDWNLIKPSCSSTIIIVVLSILLCVMFYSIRCETVSKPEGRTVANDYWYTIAKIDGHEYVIGGTIGQHGVGLTHSESCSCKKVN